MMFVEVWVMDLPPREDYTTVSGYEQNRPRALFIALLPPGDALYTAAGVVKNALPGKDDHEVYVSHHRPLNTLARSYGLKDGGSPGPDNRDMKTGVRFPGKKPGTLQPCRWNRNNWLEIIGDDVYEWLLSLNRKIIALAREHPGSRFFCDIDTWEITIEPITDQRMQVPSSVKWKPVLLAGAMPCNLCSQTIEARAIAHTAMVNTPVLNLSVYDLKNPEIIGHPSGKEC